MKENNFRSRRTLRAAMPGAIALASLLAGCMPGNELMREKSTTGYEAGTLLVGEAGGWLGRDMILKNFAPEELALAGWSVDTVQNGAVVTLTNGLSIRPSRHRMALPPGVVAPSLIYALVRPEMAAWVRDLGKRDKFSLAEFPWPDAYMDVVTVRVIRPGLSSGAAAGLNIVESVVMDAGTKGECLYEDRLPGRDGPLRYRLYCRSLLDQGWEWDGMEFIKRP